MLHHVADAARTDVADSLFDFHQWGRATHKPQFNGEWVKLGDITKIITGKLDANAANENGRYPFFTCAEKALRIDTAAYDCECVLVAGNGDLNVKYYNGPFNAYQRTYIIESNSAADVCVPYLYHFLSYYVATLRAQSIGGVIKYIKLGNLKDARLLLPPLEKQKAVSSIFELIDKSKHECDKQLSNLNDLVKSQFVEMFGDPNKTQCTTTLEDAFFIRDDLRKPLSGKERESMKEGALYPYYGANGVVDWINQYLIDTDALCFAEDCGSYGPDEPTAYIIREKAWVNNHAHLLLPRVPYFLEYACSCFRLLDVSRFISGTTRSKMTQAQLKQIKIGIPESARLKEFADFVARVDKLGFGCCRMTTYCDALFSSMSASLLCT